MQIHFTKHAKEKIKLLQKYGFKISKVFVRLIIQSPLRIENRNDATTIANGEFDENHIIRIVHRHEGDRIIVITLYPGRRKAYGL